MSGKYKKVRSAQSKFTKDLGIDQSVIANWIAGRSDIGIDYIVKLSKIFNKTEKEIKNIFCTKNILYARNIKNNNREILEQALYY